MGDQLEKENILKKIYYNTSDPGSFGGKEKLYREAKRKHINISRKDVQSFLEKQLVYTLHKKARRKFKRNPIFAEKINENFQADLADMREYSNENQGYNYILTCIDVLSRKAWALPLKNKSQFSVSKAMEEIIKTNKPMKLMTDRGKEFENSTFKTLMKKYNINHFFTNNKEIKCSIVERFNQTLKNRVHKNFTKEGNHKFLGELQNQINAYNNSKHSKILMAPNEVNETNESEVFRNLYNCENKREYLKKMKAPNLKVGTFVRQKYILGIHDRGYYPNWTDQIFIIHKALKGRNKPQYILKDEEGNILKKRFYPEEIQKIQKQPYRIEKVLKSRRRKGVKELFVKWLNYPESQNSWILASNLININGE